MKKRCCTCNITQKKLCCNNHDLACCISKLSLKSDVNIHTDFLDKPDLSSKTITFFIVKDVAPNILCEKTKIICGKLVKTDDDIAETKNIIDEIRRTKNITRKQHNILFEKIYH